MSASFLALPVVRAAPPKGSTGAALVLWPAGVGIVFFFIAIAYAPQMLNDPDTLWHIGVGRWIIEHRAIPYADPFSYTYRGQIWVPQEWLSEVILAMLFGALSWGGVVATAALAMAAALAILTHCLMRDLEPSRAAFAAVFAFLLTEAHLVVRPHVLAMPLLVLWIAGLVRARDENRAPTFWLLPVMVLWCNLHGEFVVGLGFAVLLAAEAVLEATGVARWDAARRWGLFVGLAVASALVSPNGLDGLLLAHRLADMQNSFALVKEWRSPDFQTLQPLELWLDLVLLGALSFGLRLPPTRTLMVLALLHLALQHVRSLELVGFIAPLLVAAPLASQYRRAGEASESVAPAPIGGTVVAVGLAVILFAGTAVLLNARRLEPSGVVAPVAAVAAAKAAGLDGPVFNAYGFGGYLIFAGVPVFIDGRADPYTDAFIGEYGQAEAAVGDTLQTMLARYGVRWTLLMPGSPAASLLDHLPGWQRVYGDKYAVVHRRTM